MQAILRFTTIALMLMVMAGCYSKEERRDSFITKAQKLEKQGRYAEARIEVRNALKLDINSVPALLVLARCNMHTQDWRGAFAGFSRALELEPNNTEALLSAGRFFLLADDIDKVEKYAKTVLEQGPGSLEARVLLGGVALRRNQLAEAREIFLQVLEQDAESIDAVLGLLTMYRILGNNMEAENIIEYADKIQPTSKNFYMQALNYYLDQKNYSKVEYYGNRLLEVTDNDANMLIRMVEMYAQAGFHELADLLLKKHLKAKKPSEELYLSYADLLIKQEKYSEALETVRKISQRSARARLLEAALLLGHGSYDEGLKILEALNADRANNGEVGINAGLQLVDIYVKRNQGDKAIQLLDSILEHAPGNSRALAIRSRTHLKEKRYEYAVADLRRILQDNPDDSATTLLLAEALYASGNVLSAENCLRELLIRQPDFVSAYIMLSKVYIAQKKTESALELLYSGVKNNPENKQLMLALAGVHFEHDNSAAAKTIYEAVLNNAAEKVPALLGLGIIAQSQNEPEKAEKYFEQALRFEPLNMLAAEGYAKALIAQERDKDLLAWAESYSLKYKSEPAVAYLHGEIAMSVNDVPLAESLYRQALELKPDWDKPMNRLIHIYLTGNNLQLQKALELARLVVDLRPGDVSQLTLLGSLEERYGDKSTAETLYRKVIAQAPHIYQVRGNFALLLLSNPTPERLDEALQIMLETEKTNDSKSADILGQVYMQLGDGAKAEASFRRACGINPEQAAYRLHLAQALLLQGKRAEWQEELQKIMNLPGQSAEKTEAARLIAQ